MIKSSAQQLYTAMDKYIYYLWNFRNSYHLPLEFLVAFQLWRDKICKTHASANVGRVITPIITLNTRYNNQFKAYTLQ